MHNSSQIDIVCGRLIIERQASRKIAISEWKLFTRRIINRFVYAVDFCIGSHLFPSLYLVYNIYCILAIILGNLAGATSGAVLLLTFSEHINSSCSWWGMGTVLLVCSFLISLCLAVCLFIGQVFVLLFLFTIFSHHILFSSVFITRCIIIDLPWMSMKASSTFRGFADNILCNIADTSWLFLSFNIIERTCKEVLHISWWSHSLYKRKKCMYTYKKLWFDLIHCA